MHLRRSGNRTDRRRLAPSARKSTSVQLLLESLEPRRLLTANDVGSSAALDINDPQIVVAQGDLSVPIAPVQSGSDIVSFYGYDTANSHASNTGYETSGLVTFLVHEDASGETGLVVLVDVPHDQFGGTVNLDIDGLNSAIVAVEDDPNEPTPSSGSTLFARSWNAQASDGAAFSHLGYYFSITVEPNYLFGVDGFQVIDGADDSTVAIPLADEAFEIYAEYGLQISDVPSVVSEAAGTMIVTITRGGAIDEDLLVDLQNDDLSRATVPQTVLIPAGSSSAEFTIDLIDNSLPHDAHSLGISASANHLRSAQVTVDIVDDDSPLLDVVIELALYDSNGIESSSGYLVAGTTATHVAFVSNTHTSTFSQPIVFDDSQTPDNSSDDVMFTPHLNASDTNVGDLNNNFLFDPGEVWQYSRARTVESGEHLAQVYCGAIDPALDIVLSTATPAEYFGVLPAVAFAQSFSLVDGGGFGTNMSVLSGLNVTANYQLTNQGNVNLADVAVAGAAYVSGDTNTDNILDIGEVWTYSQTSSAESGAQSVSAEVTARDALTNTTVATSVTGSYFGAAPTVALSQSLAASHVLSGASVEVEYQLTNQGNVGLADVAVSGAAYVSGDTNTDNILDIGEVWTYSQTSSAAEGAQSVSAEVTARDALTNTTVETSATGSYFGAAPTVALSQSLAALHVLSGASVEVEYQLTNQGNVNLADVAVSGAAYVSGDTNTDNILDIGEVWTYSQTSSAAEGAQSVSAEVTARDALTNTTVATSVTGSYFGAAPTVALSQSLAASHVLSGASVEVEYQLTNQGNVGLADVAVSGAAYVSGDTNTDNILDIGEVWIYSQTSSAESGAQSVSAEVTARDALTDTTVATSVTGSYFGATVDWVLVSQWDGVDDQQFSSFIVGESFHLAFYLENVGNVELTNVEMQGAVPVLSGQAVDGDFDGDGQIDPGEVWKYESFGTVALGAHTQIATAAAASTRLGAPLVSSLETSYFGQYRSLAVTHTGDEGLGSLRYAIEDAASRPEGGQIYFDLSEDDPNFVDIDNHLPGGDTAGDIFLFQPLSALPSLDGSGSIEILGSGPIPIVIDGSLAGSSHGLEIFSDGNLVRDLTIQNFEISGIHVLGSENTIAGNRIGINTLDGEAGNGGDGIWIENGSQNLIGGEDEDGVDQNIIAYNAGNGVGVQAGTANRISTNAFYENVGMGIDLGRDGFTPNDVQGDSLDADSGANNLINKPVITRIEIIGQTVEVDYQVPVNSAEMEGPLRIEFFRTDASRREGAEFLGTDTYTAEDVHAGGKTLVVEIDEFPDPNVRIVATATSALGNTSEFSAPSGIRFTGRSDEATQQDVVDNVADGILAKLESLLSGPTPVPTPAPGQPIIIPSLAVHDFVVDDPVIEQILIGRNVFAEDETDCALNVGSGADPLLMIGFGEAVDDVTMAVNDYCVEQVYDLADSFSLTAGQMVAVIWFDPINFTVSIGDNQVSYDYDNNPTELAGSIPGASLVVTSASATTPGGVQGIMFAGDASTINVQMSTTSSGELMRGGVNIYTVGTGAGGTTIQPSIRTVFQGHLPGESVMMAFDPSAAPKLLVGGGAGSTSQSMAGISSPGTSGGGAGGGIPMSIPGIFSGANGFELAFLDPASMANAGLDISGSSSEAGEDESDIENLENQVQEEYGSETDGREEEDEDTDLDGREERDEDFDEFEDAPPVEDEEEIEESISAIFDLLGGALASQSGRIDVMEILTQGSTKNNHQHSSSSGNAEVGTPRWAHSENEYDQMVTDRWATSFDVRESDKTWTDALVAVRGEG